MGTVGHVDVLNNLLVIDSVKDSRRVDIYTDGACSGNPGRGGIGVVMVYERHRRELSEGFRKTTNNRMELLAAIKGLQALRVRFRVSVYSDSKYLVDAVEKGWANRWRANGWMRNKKEPALNSDLWKTLLDCCEQHEVRFYWVKGHSGHPENDRCDQLATSAISGSNLNVDEVYENLSR